MSFTTTFACFLVNTTHYKRIMEVMSSLQKITLKRIYDLIGLSDIMIPEILSSSFEQELQDPF